MYLLNAFSLNMLADQESLISIQEISEASARENIVHVVSDDRAHKGQFPREPQPSKQLRLQSAVGHADTARILTGIFGVEIPVNRTTVSLKIGDQALVAQYTGPRLPEGATTLPEGASLRYLVVHVNNPVARQQEMDTISKISILLRKRMQDFNEAGLLGDLAECFGIDLAEVE